MTSTALHQAGRAKLLASWPGVTGVEPGLAELQIAGAVANLESAYGTATFRNKHAFTDSDGNFSVQEPGDPVSNTDNWGAMQCSNLPPCDGVTCFEATDTSPRKITDQNPLGYYQACFQLGSGPSKFIKLVTVNRPNSWAAMRAGDIDAFSQNMHDTGYYEGFGATVADRVNNHAHAVEQGVNAIAAALGEPVMATRGGADLANTGPWPVRVLSVVSIGYLFYALGTLLGKRL